MTGTVYAELAGMVFALICTALLSVHLRPESKARACPVECRVQDRSETRR